MEAFQEWKQMIKDVFWVLKGRNRVSQITLEGQSPIFPTGESKG